MGNQLGPTLANFFWTFGKRLFVNPDNTNMLPKLYLRYIDNFYAVFKIKVFVQDI